MKTTIYSNKMIIGTADLIVGDDCMGVLNGEFIPNKNYSKIQNQVQKFNSNKRKDFDLWDRLRVNAQLENGYFIHALGGVSIWDIKEFQEGKIEIDIAGVFRHVIDDFFKTVPPSTFLEKPWESILLFCTLYKWNER